MKGGMFGGQSTELGSDAMGGYSLEDYIYSLETAAMPGPGDRTPNTHLQSGMLLELKTKVHPKVRNHGEGPY